MLVLPAPAKLNLYLHITGKRRDGYHLLDTVFQLIDLCDTIRLNSRHDGRIVLHTPIAGLPDAQHLAVKAAVLLQRHTAATQGADIWVDKRIPSGAGLGGGSSDAASTLMGLNHLWGSGLGCAELCRLGLSLGADVPFFCSALGTAHATGVGEILTALNTGTLGSSATNNKGFIVVYPGCHVPTPSVFKHSALHWPQQRKACNISSPNVVETLLSEPFQNDLQTPACLIAPPIEAAITWLQSANQGTLQGVRMSGSGSAVFAQFAGLEQAKAALVDLQNKPAAPAEQWQIWAVQGLQAHPVPALLNI